MVTSGLNQIKIWSTSGIHSGVGLVCQIVMKCPFFVMGLVVFEKDDTGVVEIVAGGGKTMLHVVVDPTVRIETTHGVPHTVDFCGSSSSSSRNSSRNSSTSNNSTLNNSNVGLPKLSEKDTETRTHQKSPMKGLLLSNGLVQARPPPFQVNLGGGTCSTGTPRFSTGRKKSPRVGSHVFKRNAGKDATVNSIDLEMGTCTPIESMTATMQLSNRNMKKKKSKHKKQQRNRNLSTTKKTPRVHHVQGNRSLSDTKPQPWVVMDDQQKNFDGSRDSKHPGEWKLGLKNELTSWGSL